MTRSYRSHHLLLAALFGTAVARTTGSLGRRMTSARRRLDGAPDAIAVSETFVLVVDDPHGFMRLIAVDGPIDRDALTQVDVAVSGLAPGVAVHVDLNAASNMSSDVLDELEAVFDRVESAGTRLRVIGIDPRPPALPRSLGS